MPDLQPPTPITEAHDVSAFDCGKPPLDEFIKLHALAKQRAMLSRTYVVSDGERVVAYSTLAYVTIHPTEAPKKFARRMPDAIPAMLLARLAIDRHHQGLGLGRSLFADALRRTWATMSTAPAPVRLFIVDAKDDEAKRFYERFDIIPSPVDPRRLFLSYKTLQAIFEGNAD